MIATKLVDPAATAVIALKDEKLWSPDSPFLYDLKFSLVRKGKTRGCGKQLFCHA